MVDLSTVEQQISKAARENTHESNNELFRILQGHEVFFGVKLDTVTNQKTGELEQRPVSSPLLTLPEGLKAFVVYTTKENKALPSSFGGAPWERALQIMVSMAQSDGLLLINQAGDTIAVSKENAKRILEKLNLTPRRHVRSEN